MSQKQRPTLTKGRRKQIADYKIKNPDASYAAIADLFQCSAAQVRYAITQAKKGKTTRKYTRKNQIQAAKLRMEEKSKDELFRNEVVYALALLSAKPGLDPVTRINALDKVARIEERMFNIEMGKHLKGMDFIIYSSTIRRFMPEASDKDILKIFNEVKAECQVSRS